MYVASGVESGSAGESCTDLENSMPEMEVVWK